MGIFSREIIQKRKDKLAASWDSILQSEDAVAVFCGAPLRKPGGLDQTYPFLPHPCYFWLTGRRRMDEVILYSKKTGWIEFHKPISQAEKFWEGLKEESLGEARSIDDIVEMVQRSAFKHVYLLGEVPDESAVLSKDEDPEVRFHLQAAFDTIRRVKDAAEIEIVRKAASMALKGYQRIQSILRPGLTERDIQIEYETEIFKAGSEGVPYETIVGSGRNAAIIHAIPTRKVIREGELVLVDAGAQVEDYCVDITRVYAADGKFSSQQQDIYDLVKLAQSKAIKKARPGVFWHEVHLEAAGVIAEGLKSLNLMRGPTQNILESGAISVFLPHGVGHLVGLRVRDVGHQQNLHPQKYAGASLRVDLKLEKDFLITFEPGCYFIEAFFGDPDVRHRYKDFINWDEVSKWKDFGGVRIEDDLLIADGEAINLTSDIPK